jgi:aminoglycoside 6'-N-acetyltransferase
VTLRPLAAADASRLGRIVAEPEIARWWLGLTEQDVLEMAEPDEAELVFAVELDGEVIGLAQAGEETDPQYRRASLDIFLGTEWHGLGLGADTIRTLARWLFEERGHHRITIDPALANERAIRSYERVGFKRVGVMRRYERGTDGEWHDGLLLDLLPEDLAT